MLIMVQRYKARGWDRQKCQVITTLCLYIHCMYLYHMLIHAQASASSKASANHSYTVNCY